MKSFYLFTESLLPLIPQMAPMNWILLFSGFSFLVLMVTQKIFWDK